MAALGESETGGALLERILFGMVFAAVAAFEASRGLDHVLFAGFFAGAALYLLRPSSESGRQMVNFAVDFAAVGVFTALCDVNGVLWRAPETFAELFRFSPVGAGTATILYVSGVLALTARSRMPLRVALFLLPFLFSLFVALGAPPITQIGRYLMLNAPVPEAIAKIAGRTLVLFVLNEAIVVGVPMALGRFLPRQWRPHGILFFSAFVASLTPFIASAPTIYIAPFVPTPVAAALAQAGLWGQTYLVTQAIAGLLRATPSL
jgi:cyclic beta-1,2-glucan synthetase